MFLQLISLGICDGAFSCVCFPCVGILGKKLFLWEKKQFLLLSGHGPNQDLNWTLNHKLAVKPVLIHEWLALIPEGLEEGCVPTALSF